MCKKFPGPRCAGHTRPAMIEALKRYNGTPTEKQLTKYNEERLKDGLKELEGDELLTAYREEQLARLNEAREAYLETPEGHTKAILRGYVEVPNEDGTVGQVPLQEFGDYPDTPSEGERNAMAEVYRARREEANRAYKEHRAEEEQRMVEHAVKNPEAYYEAAEAFYADEGVEELEYFGDALEPVEGEELDADGYGLISGINKRGFRKSDGKHYKTDDDYDEHGVSNDGWTKLNICAKTGKWVDEDGYNRRGFDPKTKLHKNGTRYDEKGRDYYELDKEGWGPKGWNHDRTRHRDTAHLPEPHCRYDGEGYGPDLRDANGYHKVEGTDKRDFTPEGIYYPHRDLPPPACYADKRGFMANRLHQDRNSRFGPDGYDWRGYDDKFMNKLGQLDPEEFPNASTALLHTHPLYVNPLVKHGLTERNGWSTSNAKGQRRLFPVLVKTGFRYRKQPYRMMFEMAKVTLKHNKTKKQATVYTVNPLGAPNRTVAFGSKAAMSRYIKALGDANVQVTQMDDDALEPFLKAFGVRKGVFIGPAY